MDGTVIVADDDRTIRTVLSQALTRAGCRVRATSTIATLWQWVEAGEGDVVVTDVIMPDGDALDLIPAIRRKRPDLPVLVMSAQNTVVTAIRAAEVGAFEYLPKPFDLREMLGHVSRALAPRAPEPSDDTRPDLPDLPLIGGSHAMQDVYRIMARLMNTDLSVMINGESGTGKELVARSLHNFGHRAGAPFVSVIIGAIPESMLEAELFGRDASGTQAAEIGKLEQAAGGTLFLDEFADMPLDAQKKLLRVLQDGSFRRIGGRRDIRADLRIISASHQDLPMLIDEGRFREDLYYRMNVVPIHLPPLRDRIEDIPDLARHFLRQAEAAGLPAKSLSKDAIDRLRLERWPGNVRELENFIQRIVALSANEVIDADIVDQELNRRPSTTAFPQPDSEAGIGPVLAAHLRQIFDRHGAALPPPGLYHRILAEIEAPLLTAVLEATRGNQLKAAEVLGLNRNTLRKKLRELDIGVARSKKMM